MPETPPGGVKGEHGMASAIFHTGQMPTMHPVLLTTRVLPHGGFQGIAEALVEPSIMMAAHSASAQSTRRGELIRKFILDTSYYDIMERNAGTGRVYGVWVGRDGRRVPAPMILDSRTVTARADA
jgi:hypothetical protein